MPQGNFKKQKALKTLVPQKKTAKKTSLKSKKGRGIIPKKNVKTESRKLQVQLRKSINAKIFDDVKAVASNQTSFKILKSTPTNDSKKKKK